MKHEEQVKKLKNVDMMDEEMKVYFDRLLLNVKGQPKSLVVNYSSGYWRYAHIARNLTQFTNIRKLSKLRKQRIRIIF